MFVKEMAVTDRPATRARNIGVHVLSNAELLTVLLGAPDSAMAGRLLAQSSGSFRRLAKLPKSVLEVTTGVGPSNQVKLAGLAEYARRWACEEAAPGVPIQSPRDVVQHAAPIMEDLDVEEMHVYILDAQHRLKRDVTVSRGILNTSLVHPREIFKEAIAESAAAIILVHNHPSGDPAPSADDRAVTEQLAAAGRVMDIPVHDHVIIGKGRYTSFAESGLL